MQGKLWQIVGWWTEMDIKLIFSSSAAEKLCHNPQEVGDVGKISWMGSSLHPLTVILCRALPCPLLSHLKLSLSSSTGMLWADSDTKSICPSSWLLFRKLVLDGQDYHVETWLMWWVSEKDLFCYHTGLPFSFFSLWQPLPETFWGQQIILHFLYIVG